MKDSFSRTIDYMRISVTNRCNMRCNYCMPVAFKNFSSNEILSYDEILELIKAAVRCGITKYKITGGEPLVRPKIVEFVSKIKNISGVEQVTMTTNGVLLENFVEALKNAGLDAVNISLDSLNPKRFEKITGFDLLNKVMDGISAALSHNIPTKINTVLQFGINDDEWDNFIQITKENPVDVRFIELMPLGEGKNFQGITNTQILSNIKEKYQNIYEDKSTHGNGPAVYLKIPGFAGSIGFISAICDKFCARCNRLRLTADGKLKPCLSFADSIDVKKFLRNTNQQKNLEEIIKEAIEMKPLEHNFENPDKISETRKMFEIGG